VSRRLLPNFLNCFEYVNASEIAAGLSPFNPESVAQQAGRLMLERLQTLSNSGSDFAFETTLASRTFVLFLRSCRAKGYTINLIYFWLPSPELANRNSQAYTARLMLALKQRSPQRSKNIVN
jgi:predicted ABC-type ATPase